MRSKILIFIAIFSFIVIGQSCQSQDRHNQNVKVLAVAEFSQKITELADNAILLDVRTPAEYQEGHLAKSTLMDWNGSDFAEQAEKLDKNKPICVYCAKGGRSAAACSKLASMGFKEVYDMQGGISAWKGAGKAVEQ